MTALAEVAAPGAEAATTVTAPGAGAVDSVSPPASATAPAPAPASDSAAAPAGAIAGWTPSGHGSVEPAPQRVTLREYRGAVLALSQAQANALNRSGKGRHLSVEPAENHGEWLVTARNYVGTVTVDGLEVLVRPKIPLRNLFLLLEVGLREQDWRDEAARYERDLQLLPAMVSLFTRTAETALARGLYHSYREQHDRLISLRGRPDMARLSTRPGLALPVPCRFTEFTADLIENTYLKAAVWRSLRLAGVQPADRRRLMQHLVTLEDVAEVGHHPDDFDMVVFTRLNEHYKPALRLARLVLENLTLRDALGAVEASSFMVDMNDLFERFVTERLRRALRGRLEVKDQQPSHLDEEHTVAVRPDLVFHSGMSTNFVADIKYKLTDESAGGSNADLYQLLAYATALNLPEGLLIYCLKADGNNGNDNGTESAGDATTADPSPPVGASSGARAAVSSIRVRHTGTVLHTYALDLSGTPDAVGKNIEALADWIVERAHAASSAAAPAALTA